MEIRVLVSNYEAGVIIGSKGSNVKSIREKTGTLVSILKSDDMTERVMSIKGEVGALAQAILLMTELIVSDKQKKENDLAQQSGQQVPSPLTSLMTVKLLINNAHTGAVIGKQGAIIKEVNSVTGAKVHLANVTLPGSTEKTVTITGTPSAIHQATLRVLQQIHDNPLKPNAPQMPYVPGGRSMGGPPGYSGPGGYGGEGGYSPYGGYSNPAPPPRGEGPDSSQKIAIPTSSAGAVLGKGGTIVADIKRQTGTNIRIAPADQEVAGERVVTVTGSAQGIQAAIALIRQRVEQPFAPWSGGAVQMGPPPSSAPVYGSGAMAGPMGAPPMQGYAAPNPYAGYYQ